MNRQQRYNAIVMGASAGGLEAIRTVLTPLPQDFGLPILIVQHLHASDDGEFVRQLDHMLALRVTQAEDKATIQPGQVYIAPANYHLLVDQDDTLALSVDERVNWSRPSIDVLFESAARIWHNGLIGIILTGANADGSRGLQRISEQGGLAIVQDPATAQSPEMPRAAIQAVPTATVLATTEIGLFLRQGVKFK